MKFKSFKIIVLFSLILGISVLGLAACSSAKNKLPKYEFMKINNQDIQSYEVEDVRLALINLDTTEYQFHNKPDFVIYAHTSEKKFDLFCVYLDEGLIYQGDVFKAMLDDLTKRKSSCLQMDEEALELMKDLESSY